MQIYFINIIVNLVFRAQICTVAGRVSYLFIFLVHKAILFFLWEQRNTYISQHPFASKWSVYWAPPMEGGQRWYVLLLTDLAKKNPCADFPVLSPNHIWGEESFEMVEHTWILNPEVTTWKHFPGDLLA